MAGWTNKRNLIAEEIKQRGEEGCDISGFYERHAACSNDDAELDKLYNDLCALEIRPDFPYGEPNGADEIAALRDGFVFTPTQDIDRDKFHGAWLGRAAGCALGKPLETGHFMGGSGGRQGWENVKLWFTEAGEWPIAFYTPGASPAREKYGLEVGCPASTREKIAFMETDDDIRYTVLGLIALERFGERFGPFDIGNLWFSELPYNFVCTAERQAYLNFAVSGDIADPAERLRFTREYLNPYREWIGAQIRVDAYGYAAAGDPARAAAMAFSDASFSHVKNGIYGAMFIAAVIASAFGEAEKNRAGLLRCIKAGLSVIPKTSRLYADILRTIEICDETNDTDRLVEKLWKEFNHYHPVHTNNNAALCAASLLHSDGDYEKAITTSVYGGWDTDCNGATVGSVMGALLGAAALPEKWIKPLNDTLYSAVVNFHPIKISECADRTYNVYKKLKA
jgi:ADP-ribosylglycohydrolase